jgi:hypothetical protein
MEVRANQHHLEVCRGIPVHVGMNNGICTAFGPGHAVSNDICILTAEQESLVSTLAGIRIDR